MLPLLGGAGDVGEVTFAWNRKNFWNKLLKNVGRTAAKAHLFLQLLQMKGSSGFHCMDHKTLCMWCMEFLCNWVTPSFWGRTIKFAYKLTFNLLKAVIILQTSSLLSLLSSIQEVQLSRKPGRSAQRTPLLTDCCCNFRWQDELLTLINTCRQVVCSRCLLAASNNYVFFVAGTCLSSHCLTMGVSSASNNYVFVAAETCLPSYCLAMGISSG